MLCTKYVYNIMYIGTAAGWTNKYIRTVSAGTETDDRRDECYVPLAIAL